MRDSSSVSLGASLGASLLVIVLGACDKKADKPAAGSGAAPASGCEAAATAALSTELAAVGAVMSPEQLGAAKAAMEAAKVTAVFARACVEDKWPAAAITCMTSGKPKAECEALLPPGSADRLAAELRKAMAAAGGPAGLGAPPAAGSEAARVRGCEVAGDSALGEELEAASAALLPAEFAKLKPMLEAANVAAVFTRVCVEDKWPQPAIDCMVAGNPKAECEALLPPVSVDRLGVELGKAMAAAGGPAGAGAPPAAGPEAARAVGCEVAGDGALAVELAAASAVLPPAEFAKLKAMLEAANVAAVFTRVCVEDRWPQPAIDCMVAGKPKAECEPLLPPALATRLTDEVRRVVTAAQASGEPAAAPEGDPELCCCQPPGGASPVMMPPELCTGEQGSCTADAKCDVR